MITENFSVTELSRITGKSRPTLYKYIAEYETGDKGAVPGDISELFGLIAGGAGKRDIYAYCESRFLPQSFGNGRLGSIIRLIADNWDKLDIDALEKYIYKELENGN